MTLFDGRAMEVTPPLLDDGVYPLTIPGLVAVVGTPADQAPPGPVVDPQAKCRYTRFRARTCQCRFCTGRKR